MELSQLKNQIKDEKVLMIFSLENYKLMLLPENSFNVFQGVSYFSNYLKLGVIYSRTFWNFRYYKILKSTR